ncbi:MAG: hypothetical protein ACLVHS_03120 [Blautia wexlerae]
MLNKDGFVFLAFGFHWKRSRCLEMERYIDAFNRMERLVYERILLLIR